MIDVLDAVAEIALTARAIAKFQTGIFGIGATADCALMTVRTLTCATAVIFCPVGIWLYGSFFELLAALVLLHACFDGEEALDVSAEG